MSQPNESGSAIQREVEALEQLLQELRQKQQSHRWMMGVSAGVIAVMVLAFGLSLWGSVRSNLSQEELAAAAAQRWAQIQPVMQGKLARAAAAALPTYRDAATQRFRQIAPEVQQDLQQRMERLPEFAHDRLTTQLNASLQRVAQQTSDEAKVIFPALAGMNAAEMAEQLEIGMAVEGLTLERHLTTLLEKEKQRVRSAIVNLNPPLERPRPDHDAERQLIHNLLMVADYELMNYGTEPIYLPPLRPAGEDTASAR